MIVMIGGCVNRTAGCSLKVILIILLLFDYKIIAIFKVVC